MRLEDFRLTPQQFDEALEIGLRRSRAARARNGKHRHGDFKDTAQQRSYDSLSAAAERLVAEGTGRKWLSTGTTPDEHGEDVEGAGVRWTPRFDGSLILHHEDPDDLPQVLVVGSTPATMRAVKWLYARDGKHACWWRTDVKHPAFFVKQHELEDLVLFQEVPFTWTHAPASSTRPSRRPSSTARSQATW